MKPMRSFIFYSPLRLCALFLPLILAACGDGAFSSSAPGVEKREVLGALEIPASALTTDAKHAYVFSDNVIDYNPCPSPMLPCPETLYVGNPVHSYTVDTVSGMLSPVGIEVDNPPVKTRSVAVTPSGRFMYELTSDGLLHTFSIGFSIFTEAEFKNQNMKPLALYNALAQAGNRIKTVISDAEIVTQLNALLEQPLLYDQLLAANLNLSETAEIIKLKTDTLNLRTKLYGDLTEGQQKAVVRLNRLMVELAYPALTPVNKGVRAQHEVGEPIATNARYPVPATTAYKPYLNSIEEMKNQVSFASIEMDPLARFVYVLDTQLQGAPALSVYVRDLATGQLTLSGSQSFSDGWYLDIDPDTHKQTWLLRASSLPYGIQRLIFAPSGLYAYGTNNGSLHSYGVNQKTGLLTELAGNEFHFYSWTVNDSYNNIVADPTGKFVYLIASSGDTFMPNSLGCPNFLKFEQPGSFIYTFFVDSNTGLLTQAGPPLDTTPHVITGASVDAKGRFVHLLNTHEYVFFPAGNSPFPVHPVSISLTGCQSAAVGSLDVSAIYSYSVDQATGKLNSSGSLQAGGTQISTGFVLGGADSVTLSGNKSGSFLYLLNAADMYVYNVDQANGALTVVGSPVTGATRTAAPGKYETPVTWPEVCYSGGVWNGFCTLTGSRAHSLTWAGY